jgi:hypothetical protein
MPDVGADAGEIARDGGAVMREARQRFRPNTGNFSFTTRQLKKSK